MKLLRRRYDLIFSFFFTFLILAYCGYFFFFRQLVSISQVNWLFDLAVIILFFLPQARTLLGTKLRIRSRGKWLVALFLCQLVTNLIFWSLLPVISLSTKSALDLNILTFSTHAGIFPMGFIVLSSLAWGYSAYTKQQPGSLSYSFAILFKNTHEDSVGVTVDSYTRLLLFVDFYFSLLVLTVISVLAIDHFLKLPFSFGINTETMFVCLGLLFIATQPLLKKFLHRLATRISVFSTVITVAIFLAFCCTLLSYLIAKLLVIKPELTATLTFAPSLSFKQDHLVIMITLLWFSYGFLNAAVIALCSQGRSIRQVIVGTVGTGLASWAVIFALNSYCHFKTCTFIPIATAILCHVAIIYLLVNKSAFTYFRRGMLPSGETLKTRSSFTFIGSVPFILVSFLSAYLGANIYFLSISTVALIPSIVLVGISIVGLFKALKAQ